MKQQRTRTKKKKKQKRPSGASDSSARDGDKFGQQQQQQEQGQDQDLENEVVRALIEAFDSISLEDARSAYREANGDVDKAAKILANLTDGTDDPLSMGSVSSGFFGSGSSMSSCSSSGSSEGLVEVNGKGYRGSNKQKRMVAVTGTVSALLGKDYVKASPRRDSAKSKEFGALEKEKAEQFLCSMLGDDCDLSMAVVRDVLCQCGYNIEKASNVLLDLSAPAYQQFSNGGCLKDAMNNGEDAGCLGEHSDNSTERVSDCCSYSSESDILDTIWGYGHRNYSQVLTNFEAQSTSPRSNESDLPQKVLESLFNISKSSKHEPTSMNWRNVVKKMQLLGPGVDVSDATPQQETSAKGDDYHCLRNPATQHWESVRSCYRKAEAAFSNGNREYAAYLSDQGKVQTKLAREADKKASQDIFKVRNKSIENVVTIDLHGQHVGPAMKILKLHLLFGTYTCSIQTLRVITGCGSHGVGKSKLKQAVINLLEKEGIKWSEENRGRVLIKLDGYKELSFLNSDSDTE